MMKGELLKGRGTGAPLLLAWVGAVIGFVILVLAVLSGVTKLDDDTGILRWAASTACGVILSAFQAALLFPQRCRRMCWVLAFVAASLPMLLKPPFVYDTFEAACFLQGFAFIGLRRRIWLWFVVLLTEVWIHYGLQPQVLNAYESFSELLQRWIPSGYILELYALYVMAELSLLGAVVVFLMSAIRCHRGTKESL